MRQLVSNFSHSFSGKVWNLTLTEDGSSLLFEIRDDEAYQASYSLLSLEDLNFIFSDLVFDEDWWIGVTYADKNYILFHSFENQDNPDNKTYFVYDVDKSEVLWARSELNIVDVRNNIAQNIDSESRETMFIDLNTGQDIGDQSFEELAQNKKLNQTFHYSEGSDYFVTVSKFLASLLNVKVVGGVDYFQSDDLIVISYYVPWQDGLNNELIVFTPRKDILLTSLFLKFVEGEYL
ncbi:MAG: DUF4905 domain-containing protein, partial [Bacteroidota bacterium]